MRSSTFSGDYLKTQKALVESHKKAFGQDKLPRGGYPDMGVGRYSEGLSYEAWYRFACAQRTHGNLLEWIASFILFLLVAGLFYPVPAAVAGGVWIVGREVRRFFVC